jgi:hypothetical protein
VSRKRKRKRSRARKPVSARAAPNEGREAPSPSDAPGPEQERGPDGDAPRARREDRRPRGLFRGAALSPFPPFGASLAAGFRAVGSVPTILAASFVATIVTWASFLALGIRPALQLMVVHMAASPMNVFFDWNAVTPFRQDASFLLLAAVVLGVVRAVTVGFLLALIIGWFRDRRADLGAATRRLPKIGLTLFAIYMAEVVLVAGSQVLLRGGQLFSVLVPLVLLHFLAFAPVVAAAEDVVAREAFRRGFRAARLPGGRHLGMAVAYFLFIFYVLTLTPPLSPATPTIAGWSFVLAVNFVHVGVMATFAFRWLAVREEAAITAPSGRRGRRGAAS